MIPDRHLKIVKLADIPNTSPDNIVYDIPVINTVKSIGRGLSIKEKYTNTLRVYQEISSLVSKFTDTQYEQHMAFAFKLKQLCTQSKSFKLVEENEHTDFEDDTDHKCNSQFEKDEK